MHIRAPRILLVALALFLLAGCAPSAPAAAPPATHAVAATAKPTQPAATAVPTVQPSSTAAAQPAATTPTANGVVAGVEFVDDAGRKVVVKSSQKIVSLSPSNTEILFALGLGDRVVGVTEYCNFPAETKSKPKIGGFSSIDSEKVVALAPDLVVAGSLHQSKVVPALEKLGLTVVVVEPKSVDEVFARVGSLGVLTGKAKEGEDLKATLEKRAAEIVAKAKGDKAAPRVFWMIGDGLFTAGPSSFVHGMIERANGANVAADAKTQWPELSMEAVLTADPEVIVVAAPEGEQLVEKLKADVAWQGVAAVKGGRFVVVDPDVVSRAGPRIVDGLELVARGLHPEQFR